MSVNTVKKLTVILPLNVTGRFISFYHGFLLLGCFEFFSLGTLFYVNEFHSKRLSIAVKPSDLFDFR